MNKPQTAFNQQFGRLITSLRNNDQKLFQESILNLSFVTGKTKKEIIFQAMKVFYNAPVEFTGNESFCKRFMK